MTHTTPHTHRTHARTISMLRPCTTSTQVSVPGNRRRQSGGISATIRSRSDALSPESTGPVTGCAALLAAASPVVAVLVAAALSAAVSLDLV